jgi:hypothetical protein
MALQFDGVSQKVIVSSDAGVTGGTITLSIWVKLASEISSGIWCFFLQRDYSTQVKYAIYYDYNRGTRRLNFQRTRYSIVDDSSYYKTTLGTSDWHHLVLTYDNSNVRGYKNGVLVAGPTASTGNGSISSTHPDNVFIGSEDTTRFPNAVLYDARVYNRALSANEIAEIYHKRGADRVWQGLVGWWRLDELPSGTPAPFLIDAMDATTGWGTAYDTITLDTTTKYEGSGSLTVAKQNTTDAYGYMRKKNISFNATGQTIQLYVYIKDATTLAKVTGLQMKLWTVLGSKSYTYTKTSGITTGWNLVSAHINDFTPSGSPADKNIVTVDTHFVLDSKTTKTIAGDVNFDFYHCKGYVPGLVRDLSGNGNHGTPYGGTYQASPHRLRRGVLVS